MAGSREYIPLHPAHRKRPISSFSVTNCLIPLLFVITFITAIFFIMGDAPASEDYRLEFSAVTGYFIQDDPATNPNGFDVYATGNFGLIDRTYNTDSGFGAEGGKSQWQRFAQHVAQLNDESGPDVQYKVIYMGRHGEGYHNVAEAFYGTAAWDCYWSLQPGNATSTWFDAELTPVGIGQAAKANAFWASMILNHNIPLPQSYYVSPHRRCLSTANVTFSGLPLPDHRPFKPVIKEMFRECIGVHTCDMRSPKAVIKKTVPDWIIEEGFVEEDELWHATLRETNEAQDQRAKVVFDEVFTEDPNTFISISTHSGQIASSLRVLGHREFGLGTGQAIPVLVKVEKIAGKLPEAEKAPWYTPETCSEPPPLPTS